MTASGYWVSLGGDGNVLPVIVVVSVQLCEYTKNYVIAPVKWENCMICVLYLSEAVTYIFKVTKHISKGNKEEKRVRPFWKL